VVLHIDGDLLVRLAVQNGERGSHFYFVVISDTEKGPNDSFLGIRAAKVVVEDGEKGNRVDGDTGRGAPILSTTLIISVLPYEAIGNDSRCRLRGVGSALAVNMDR
jgi:hypothetical protein